MAIAISAASAAPHIAPPPPASVARANAAPAAAPATAAAVTQATRPAAAAPAAAPATAAAVTQTTRPAAAVSASAPQGQQQAALNHLLSKYKYGQSHDVAASALSSIGRQILADAKALGQHVTLPRAPAGSGAAPAAPEATTAPATGRISVTA
ncbi:MAG TPA: hypothetical protein VGL95_16685 [Acetobacteraceae bacterium]|jgi:hypothetical protein